VDIRVNLSAHINHSLSKSSSNTDFFWFLFLLFASFASLCDIILTIGETE
jgi:hypothetical protein